MELHLNLHEQYFLKNIKEKLGNTSISNEVSSKYESLFLSGVFWVLSGLSMVNKERKYLDEILGENIINLIYKLVMQCLQKKEINENHIYNFKKKKYFLSNIDIKNIIKKSKCVKTNLNDKIRIDGKEYKGKEKGDTQFLVTWSNLENRKSGKFERNNRKDDNKIVENKYSKDNYVNWDNANNTDGHYFKYTLVNSLFSRKRVSKKKYVIKGFSPCSKKWLYEPNVISTLSAIQVLFLINRISEDDISTKTLLEIYNFLYFLLDEEKGFFHFSLNSFLFHFDGDMRFMFCTLSALYFIKLLLKKRNIHINLYTNRQQCIDWILLCFNLDGGFSNLPGSESHAGTTFCAVNSLILLKDENQRTCFSSNPLLRGKVIRQVANVGKTANVGKRGKMRQNLCQLIGDAHMWLCDRYENQGINGRVGKDSDVCYAWWVLGSLVSLKVNLSELFNVNILINFILKCQDKNNGGFSRIENSENDVKKEYFNYYERENLAYKEADLFHTFFALCALSLINHNVRRYKEKRKRKHELFGNATIPQSLENTLQKMQNVHASFAMPAHIAH
ncbi:geranylgeranyl transferase type2 beta subunit, putative [Plasmodium ovale wallikeri]|uniref:Geranylgeranyl transferase type II subunit beta n=2 Tax=Plasmodium ovale TaxID=36330 RepID=A0A1A8ZX30_PLAOA|nr:geranylgeranyl transferase type2 beta subunit, putative [Plasmodium ovale wallikeri]SBT48892.1 geranylgeranyl transferase type2 beta subunit, putative [Plasmodium ovale wallikeri]SBT82480.1 geranylgeranyl transferase type2 beta subunit, putative [Plasmodium ovale]